MNLRKTTLRTLIALTVFCLILAILPITRGGWAGLFTIPSGGSQYCSFWDKWKAGQVVSDLLERTEYLQEQSKILKTENGLRLVQTIHGQWWTPPNSTYFIFQFAELDGKIYGELRGGEIVLDCGANIGQYSKRVLEEGAAKVIAIEPAPENLECLRRNLAAEIAQGKVIVYPKGVWHEDGILPMTIDEQNSGSDSFVRPMGAQTKQIMLPLTTIDKIVQELDLTRIDVIKMDIEGAERNALQGAAQTLARFQPRLAVCVYHLPDDPEVITGLVKKMVPSYKVDCGCMPGDKGLYPQVAHFTAP